MEGSAAVGSDDRPTIDEVRRAVREQRRDRQEALAEEEEKEQGESQAFRDLQQRRVPAPHTRHVDHGDVPTPAVLFLDRRVTEGDEFLLHSYPPLAVSEQAASSVLHALRGVFSTLDGAADAVCGMPVRSCALRHTDHGDEALRAVTADYAEAGLAIVVVTSAPDGLLPDAVGRAVLRGIVSQIRLLRGPAFPRDLDALRRRSVAHTTFLSHVCRTVMQWSVGTNHATAVHLQKQDPPPPEEPMLAAFAPFVTVSVFPCSSQLRLAFEDALTALLSARFSGSDTAAIAALHATNLGENRLSVCDLMSAAVLVGNKANVGTGALRVVASLMRPDHLQAAVQVLTTHGMLRRTAEDAERTLALIVHVPVRHARSEPLERCFAKPTRPLVLSAVCVGDVIVVAFVSVPEARLEPLHDHRERVSLLDDNDASRTRLADIIDPFYHAEMKDMVVSLQRRRLLVGLQREMRAQASLTTGAEPFSRMTDMAETGISNDLLVDGASEVTITATKAAISARNRKGFADPSIVRAAPVPPNVFELQQATEHDKDVLRQGHVSAGLVPRSREEDDELPQVTHGPFNALFHHLTVDAFAGVLVTSVGQDGPHPVHESEATTTTTTTTKDVDLGRQNECGWVATRFVESCVQIREMFEAIGALTPAVPSEYDPTYSKSQGRRVEDKDTTLFTRDGSIRGAQEIGVRLATTDFDVYSTLDYWVVGRVFGHVECYVCYHDSIPQDMVEIAFQLAARFTPQ